MCSVDVGRRLRALGATALVVALLGGVLEADDEPVSVSTVTTTVYARR